MTDHTQPATDTPASAGPAPVDTYASTPGRSPAVPRPGDGLPGKPDIPRFPLRFAAWPAFAMSVATGAVGQVMFLGQVFGGGTSGYVAAGFIAAFAEIAMVASGDSALHHRVHRRAGWQLLMALSMGIALLAALLNLTHWAASNLSMAIMFAGASFVGWAIHITNGHIVATDVRRRLADYDQAVERRRQHAEQLERAELERLYADRQDARTAAARVQRELSNRPASSTAVNGHPFNPQPSNESADSTVNGRTVGGVNEPANGAAHRGVQPDQGSASGPASESNADAVEPGPAEAGVGGRTLAAPQRDRAAEAARRYRADHGHWPTVSELEAMAEVSRGTAGTVLKELRQLAIPLHLVKPNDEVEITQ